MLTYGRKLRFLPHFCLVFPLLATFFNQTLLEVSMEFKAGLRGDYCSRTNS